VGVKKAAIIQARVGSSRFANKIFCNLAGKPMMWHILERLDRCRTLDLIAIATTTLKEDDPVVEFADSQGVEAFRGSQDDVQRRYLDAALFFGAEIIVRVTADAPLVDPDMIDRLVDITDRLNLDYAITNPKIPAAQEGFEVLRTSALIRSRRISDAPKHREHVTLHIRENLALFKSAFLNPDSALRGEGYRLSVDTYTDYLFMDEIYKRLYRPGSIVDLKEVVRLLNSDPEIKRINAHIKQKPTEKPSALVAFVLDDEILCKTKSNLLNLCQTLTDHLHFGVGICCIGSQNIPEDILTRGYRTAILPEKADDKIHTILTEWNPSTVIVSNQFFNLGKNHFIKSRILSYETTFHEILNALMT